MDRIVAQAGAARVKAHAEMAAGQKRGHWVWWVFPTLKDRGGDGNSAFQNGADLADVVAAEAYAKHAELRKQLIETFDVATKAFQSAAADGKGQGPWRVLDKGFGRSSDEEWVRGPVDAFKCFCSCTLFAAIAHRLDDAPLKKAALQTLAQFQGDVVYTAGGKGTAGYGANLSRRTVLEGYDKVTLTMVGGDWNEISSALLPESKPTKQCDVA